MSDKAIIFKKLLILLALMFVLDRGIGALLKHFYFTQKTGFDARANYIINKGKADILVFGSSKAADHYDPKVFEDSLHMSVYNAGRDLSYIYYHYGVLQGVLARYTPKVVILDTRANEFQIQAGGEERDRLNVLLPYYDTHPEMREVCLLRSKFERVKMLSKMYPYNSLILYELIQFLPLKRVQVDDSDRGFQAKHGQWHGTKGAYTTNDAVDTTAARYYEKFVKECKARNIKLFITLSPIYQSIDEEHNRNIAAIYRIAKKYDIPVIDRLTKVNDPRYFYDDIHLNAAGAEMYSADVAGEIKRSLAK